MRYLLCSALAFTASLSALPNLDTRLDQLEKHMNEMSAKTVYGNYGANTASAYPLLNAYRGFVSVEGLYLKCFEGGLDFVYRNTTTASTPFNMGRTKSFPFDWRFAFRVSTGYQFKSPDWALWTEYLRFDTKQSSLVIPPPGGSLASNILFNTNPTSSRIKMEINYNTIDLNLGRPYMLRNTFSLHPYVGFRGALIHQHQKVINAFVSSTQIFRQTNQFNGVGLRAGSQARWHLGKGWNLFGSLSGSMVYGWFNNIYTQDQSVKLRSDMNSLSPNISSDLGFRWEKTFCSSRTRVSLSLGYELDYWWRQNQTFQWQSTPTNYYTRISEDLGLQGVKLNCGFDF